MPQGFLVETLHRLGRTRELRRHQWGGLLARSSFENLGVPGAVVVLERMEQFLEQLLARTQARVENGNVTARLLAGQPDHLLGKIADADRLAHVEREGLAALA